MSNEVAKSLEAPICPSVAQRAKGEGAKWDLSQQDLWRWPPVFYDFYCEDRVIQLKIFVKYCTCRGIIYHA